jgi:hypothetical protein
MDIRVKHFVEFWWRSRLDDTGLRKKVFPLDTRPDTDSMSQLKASLTNFQNRVLAGTEETRATFFDILEAPVEYEGVQVVLKSDRINESSTIYPLELGFDFR